jgi:hypothetical protein
MSNTAESYISNAARRRARRWFIPRMLFITTTAGLAQFYLPFWVFPVSCLLVGFLTATINRSAFLAGFIGISLLWSGMAFYLNELNESILSSRVVKLFPLPESSIALIITTGIIGGILGGFATKCGDELRRLIIKK